MPESAGTFPTHTPLFVVLLVGVVILVGALTYVPALIEYYLHEKPKLAYVPTYLCADPQQRRHRDRTAMTVGLVQPIEHARE